MKKIVLIAMAVLLSGCQSPSPLTSVHDVNFIKELSFNDQVNSELQKAWEEDEEYRRIHGVSQYTGMNIHGSNEKKFYLNGKLYYCHVNAYDEYICNE